jgi:hypothetical protein
MEEHNSGNSNRPQRLNIGPLRPTTQSSSGAVVGYRCCFVTYQVVGELPTISQLNLRMNLPVTMSSLLHDVMLRPQRQSAVAE